MATVGWPAEFDRRVDPKGRRYYWAMGTPAIPGEGDLTDLQAWEQGYVTLTPLANRSDRTRDVGADAGLETFVEMKRQIRLQYREREMVAIKRLIGCVLSIAVSFSLTGCGSSSSSNSGGASMDQMANAADAQKTAKEQQQAAEASAKVAAEKKAAEAVAAAQNQPSAVPERKVGGRPAPEFGGYFGAIAGARRHVMNVVDSLSWIQGVRSFKAEEGRKPKNNDEFMKVVVTRYELQLPHIEDDEEYLYDPNGETDGDFGQLYVIKKGTAPASTPTPAAK